MGVVIEICIKYPGGPTRMRGTDVRIGVIQAQAQKSRGRVLR
jgi:hypothetical protein